MTPDAFIQAEPRPRHGYRDDWLVRSFVRHRLHPDARGIERELDELGALAAGPLWDFQRADRHSEPTLTNFDAWGDRIDRIELTPLWREAERLAVQFGLTARPHEGGGGPAARQQQFLLVHLFHPVTDVYSCPLAMTDGAARTLLESGNQALAARAVPRLASREPGRFWTSGQWMTEATGGSDVGLSLTRAELRDGTWRLYGRKWFTSAATSQMALTLARPEGNGAGGSGLALFYVETRDAAGRLNGIRVERLKDKLGTRKVPTAELVLDGAVAELVGTTTHGTRSIEPMLRVTRTWNSVCAASFLRHGLGLAEDYAVKRVAFGASLAVQPLHRATLDDLDAESAGAFLMAFLLAELLGKHESGIADPGEAALLRLLTPVAKATTGKQAAAGASELIEAFGGAGYVEDTGIPVLLRDAQVMPIWEGTTNVLSLDLLLRADLDQGLAALRQRVVGAGSRVADGGLAVAAEASLAAIDGAAAWLGRTTEPALRQAGARRFALTLGRALQLALLVEHAVCVGGTPDAGQARQACLRYWRLGVDLLQN
ncbi:MAG: acyl-CoA dehydrogenase family protein [Gammaproteobacteria bacterium]